MAPSFFKRVSKTISGLFGDAKKKVSLKKKRSLRLPYVKTRRISITLPRAKPLSPLSKSLGMSKKTVKKSSVKKRKSSNASRRSMTKYYM